MRTSHRRWALFAFCVVCARPEYARALEPPWGKGEDVKDDDILARTAVCADKNAHVLVVAPDPQNLWQLYFGTEKSLKKVPPPPRLLSGNHFFDPRFFQPNANSDFRGYDMRYFSEATADKSKRTCEVRCGARTIALAALDDEKAKRILFGATIEDGTPAYRPHALLRDNSGVYYFVEKGSLASNERSFRLYVGKKGRLKIQKMIDIVADSEGEIFSTKSGNLKLIVDRTLPSWWIAEKKKTSLRHVPIDQNLTLVYNELGVYAQTKLGTPCDEL